MKAGVASDWKTALAMPADVAAGLLAAAGRARTPAAAGGAARSQASGEPQWENRRDGSRIMRFTTMDQLRRILPRKEEK